VFPSGIISLISISFSFGNAKFTIDSAASTTPPTGCKIISSNIWPVYSNPDTSFFFCTLVLLVSNKLMSPEFVLIGLPKISNTGSFLVLLSRL